MTGNGDADRFLAWVRDTGDAPRGTPEAAPEWAQPVHDAFAYAERSHGRSISATAASRIACTPGCAWCCHIPVITTLAEVRVAWRHAVASFSAAELETVRERADMPTSDAPAPCPFLIDDRCGVYPARPLACRAWNSTDAGACREAHERGHDRVPIPVHTMSRGVFANAAQALAQGIAERGGEAAVVLRGALAEVIDEADRASRRGPAG